MVGLTAGLAVAGSLVMMMAGQRMSERRYDVVSASSSHVMHRTRGIQVLC